MEEENNRSSEAPNEPVNDNSKPPDEVEEEIREEKFEKKDEHRQVSSNNNSDCTVDNALTGERGDLRASHSETLAPVQLSEGDFQFDGSSHLLSEVPVEYSLQPLQSEEFKDQIRVIHEEPLKGITGQSSQLHTQHQIQVLDGSSSLELSPISVTKSISSNLSPTPPEQKLQPVINGNKACIMEEDQHNSLSPKPLSVVSLLKTPSDGYNWRKYGQKQVKSPEGSRSYYRCTFSDCSAKKIECCDRSHRVIETVYRSHHNHDPPQKLNCSRENKPALPIVPVSGSSDITHSPRVHITPPASSKEPLPEIDQIPETKQQESSGSDETTEANVKEEYVDGPEFKKRQDSNTLILVIFML
ncbi:hypothetical protein ACJIZ3_020660 [Penstemon smallii]|uniref:WRKY domain-containing protein n=1 Tax=Penstemon smallii TaxID=265156 RepID=A0ABD3SJ87_9LAMI